MCYRLLRLRISLSTNIWILLFTDKHTHRERERERESKHRSIPFFVGDSEQFISRCNLISEYTVQQTSRPSAHLSPKHDQRNVHNLHSRCDSCADTIAPCIHPLTGWIKLTDDREKLPNSKPSHGTALQSTKTAWNTGTKLSKHSTGFSAMTCRITRWIAQLIIRSKEFIRFNVGTRATNALGRRMRLMLM